MATAFSRQKKGLRQVVPLYYTLTTESTLPKPRIEPGPVVWKCDTLPLDHWAFIEGLMQVKSVEAQSFPFGVVGKFGEGMRMVSSSLLDHGLIFRDPSPIAFVLTFRRSWRNMGYKMSFTNAFYGTGLSNVGGLPAFFCPGAASSS
ncbi:hypothetical protein TNCV_2979011 [Trichonephila clavipes]|nr:hypothetical protein TNCV_2979011 [Trichonephila clavipes]